MSRCWNNLGICRDTADGSTRDAGVMMVRPEDLIWNRAAMERGGPRPGPGDLALASLLRCHNEVMSGGMDFAISDSLSRDEVRAGINGYRYFGLDAAARVFEEAADTEDEDALTALEERYAEVVPDDDVLVRAFEALLETRPTDFAAADR
jgi:hypothetical protein